MRSICYVATTAQTLRAFVIPVAERLAADLDIDVSMMCAKDVEFSAQVTGTFGYRPVRMKRGIDLGAPAAVWRMWRLFRNEKFLAVEYTTPNAAFYASLAAFLAGVPVRIYRQGGIRYVGFSGFRRHVFKRLERWTCALSSHVEPVSSGNRNFGVEEGLYSGEKASVIWNGSASGVSLARFDIDKSPAWRSGVRDELCIPVNSVVVGFVGRLSRDKGYNELLVAAQRVISANDSVYFLIIGSLDEASGIASELVEWAKSEPRLVLCGRRQDIPECMAAMDVFVLPTYREGFGQVLIEAQAMGIPVITTSVPGPLDAVVPDATARIVPPRDAESLEQAIRRLVDDPAGRRGMGEAGRAYVAACFEQEQFMRQMIARRSDQLSAVESRLGRHG